MAQALLFRPFSRPLQALGAGGGYSASYQSYRCYRPCGELLSQKGMRPTPKTSSRVEDHQHIEPMTSHDLNLYSLRTDLLIAQARETAILLQLALIRIRAGQIREQITTAEAEAAAAGLIGSVPGIEPPGGDGVSSINTTD